MVVQPPAVSATPPRLVSPAAQLGCTLPQHLFKEDVEQDSTQNGLLGCSVSYCPPVSLCATDHPLGLAAHPCCRSVFQAKANSSSQGHSATITDSSLLEAKSSFLEELG